MPKHREIALTPLAYDGSGESHKLPKGNWGESRLVETGCTGIPQQGRECPGKRLEVARDTSGSSGQPRVAQGMAHVGLIRSKHTFSPAKRTFLWKKKTAGRHENPESKF